MCISNGCRKSCRSSAVIWTRSCRRSAWPTWLASALPTRRLFQQTLGVPVHRYILAARLEQARKLLAITSQPISRIADDCGFSSQSHFTACFRAAHAITPADYRKYLHPVPFDV